VPQALEFHQLDRRLEHLRVRHPARHRHLIASLADTGQQTPIIVIQQDSRYLVIDGHKRIAAIQTLGRDTVNAVVWDMSEAEALLLARSLAINSEPETALEQGWLLAELEEKLGHSLEELARRFDRSPTWVARRLSLVETLPESVQQQVRDGKIGAQIAMRYLAPVARVNAEQCVLMAQAFAQQHWTTRQAATLYNAWRDAKSAQTRERILAKPELFLKTQQQQPPPTSTTLESELNKIIAIAQRALQQLEVPHPKSETVKSKIHQATALLDQLTTRIFAESEEQTSNHVEPSATHHDSGVARQGDPQARDRAPAEPVATERPHGAASELERRAEDRTRRESRALPPADPRVITHLQRQSRASP
jgi:ParB family chromosome partitioning protein